MKLKNPLAKWEWKINTKTCMKIWSEHTIPDLKSINLKIHKFMNQISKLNLKRWMSDKFSSETNNWNFTKWILKCMQIWIKIWTWKINLEIVVFQFKKRKKCQQYQNNIQETFFILKNTLQRLINHVSIFLFLHVSDLNNKSMIKIWSWGCLIPSTANMNMTSGNIWNADHH